MRLSLKTIVILFALGGCTKDRVIEHTKTTVIDPPAQMYICDDYPSLPNGKVLKSQTRDLLLSYEQVVTSCKQALTNIHDFVAEQKKIVETPNK